MNGLTQISDEEILTLLQNKDKRGVSNLYRQHAQLLYGLILRIVKVEHVAENVLQDVFLKVWQNIDNYAPSKGRFLAWVVNIARNASIDVLRSKEYKKSKATGGLEGGASDRQFAVGTGIENIGVRDAVKMLEPKYQLIVELIYFEGYTQIEVSEELDLPLGTVKSRVRKAFQDLKILLQ
jgi:RNA polymerase sigma-70 factor (ECF subfamily)